MASQLPIRFQEVATLSALGIENASIGFNTCNLQSSHYICVRQTTEGATQPEVIIIDLHNANHVIRRPIKADSAILHPNQLIIALKAQQRTLQIFDLSSKSKLKSTTMSEDVVYWTFIDDSTLGLVTDSAVWSWDIFEPQAAAPTKVFERNQQLAGCQIISLRTGAEGQWMVLVGISQQQGRVVGSMQLYSKARGISQNIEGHAAAFATIRLPDSPVDTHLFTFAVRTAGGAKMHVVEIDHQPNAPTFPKKAVDLFFPENAVNDFPVAMQVSKRYNIAYVATKYGFIHLYDLETGRCLFMNRISSETIFTTAPDQDSTGIVLINRKGQVLTVSVDENTIIPYLLQNSENAELAYKLASKGGLPGADNLYQQRFEQLFNSGQHVEAAKIAANSPRGFLRTQQTIERLKAAPQTGNMSVILQYFSTLLDRGGLNKFESVELAKPVMAQNRAHLIEKWLGENKLECSEELGDLVRPADKSIAFVIYEKAHVAPKVVACLAELGQFDRIIPYAESQNYSPNYDALLAHIVTINPDKGAEFATNLYKANPDAPLINMERVVDIFQSQAMYQAATSFLLDVLSANLPEQAHLQTRLLEMNLMQAPQVADAILGNDMFTHFDKTRIAGMCENAGLISRALELSEDPAVIKRLIVQTDKLSEEWIMNYFGKLSVEQSLDCLNEMLRVNIRQTLQVVIRIAQKYSELLGPTNIIDLLEKYKTAEGLYYYLGGIVNVSEDKDVHFKYIEAATRIGQTQEVERICRDSSETDVLSLEQVAAKEDEVRQKRAESTKASYYGLKTTEFEAWQAQRCMYDSRRDPEEKTATAKKVGAKARPSWKYACDICDSSSADNRELSIHNATRKHLDKAAGVHRIVKASTYSGWAAANTAAYHYDAEKVKNFLKEAKLTEQLPLIIVCDRFNFVHDLVLYLYNNQQFKSIELYAQRVNPSRTPFVVGGLLDVDCDEKIIKDLLASVDPASIPIDELVHEVESRNRLKLLLPFLESTLAAGNQQQAVYNALAKIYIDSNNNPEKFLRENDLYDPLTVGKYCEKRDPNLASIAYTKGQNDLELISITNENGMFRQQARYLLERADAEIWSYVLSENNVHRRSLVDQVVATAVPEASEPEKVSVAVKAFLDNDLPAELIELLEKIILEPSPFSDNTTLQNLLILTAIKTDKGRVMDYISRLEKYTPDDVADNCVGAGMYEEAFEIYKKQDNHLAAANVLVDHVVSIDRAQEYADKVDLPEVWSKVGKAQLDGLRVPDAIESYIKANDASNYNEVIDIATHAGKDDELIRYLKMARKTQREPPVDTALAFCYARTNQMSELESFLRGTNVADIEASGDKAYQEGFYEASKVFFTSISNWAKLATTLVHLEDYQAAVECARKANSTKVWRQVNEACVAKKEFRLAQICGLNLIVHAEELQALVQQYEYNGYFDELIALLEAGLGLERAHMGMFTELGLALSKYHPDRVMEHLRLFWSRINIPKAIRGCEAAHLWPEVVFLYIHYQEHDNAALAMMERSADAWEHQSFKEIIVKVTNLEVYYRALNFYLQEQPTLLTDLLQALTPRIDVNRVVKIFEKSDNMPLIKPFLHNVQSQNKRSVNNAMNDLLIEEEDYKTLRDSVENYDNYDPVTLAQRLEKHELVFFRQIAASIYRKNKRWDKSISLSKQDKLFKDAIETAAISSKRDVVVELLRYFVDIGSRECYVGMLYACYDLIPLDVVMEVSWRNGLNDFTMPFMINFMSQQAATIETLRQDNEERKAREASQQKTEEDTPILNSRLMLTQGPQMNGIATQPTGYRGF